MAEGQANQQVLDVGEEQLARRYAHGFLGAAGDQAESAVAELDDLDREVLAKQPRLLETLGSAFLEHDQRVELIDRVFGGRVSPIVVTLLKVLSKHGRVDIARGVVAQARKLFNESQNRIDVVVRLASPASDSQVDQIAAAIREKLGIEPVMSVEVDPGLIGGLEIRVGDTVFDGSLRTAFSKAHKSIVNQTIQAIETQPERFTLAG